MREYDLIVSLGANCPCSQVLRTAGLQFASFPFDWVMGPPLSERAKLLADGFSGWLDRDALKPVHATCTLAVNVTWENDLGYTFVHDFHRGIPLERELPKVREKYFRRIDRLNRLLASSARILFVFIASPDCGRATADEPLAAQQILQGHWPQAKVDLLVFTHADGIARESPAITESEGVRHVSCDYLAGEDPWRTVDVGFLAHWMAGEYSVRDYRTDEERRNEKRNRRRSKYAKMNATGWLDCLVASFEYKVYRHFHRLLERRGLARRYEEI